MLLSFSVDYMRPYIEAGIRQMAGKKSSGPVKRQTIRARGPRAEVILKQADPKTGSHMGTLHFWWKSRTREKAFLGEAKGFHVFPIHMTRGLSHVQITVGDGQQMVWTLGIDPPTPMLLLIAADGFKTVHSFLDYFLPKTGTSFSGILYKW